MASRWAREKAAAAWCTPETRGKVMDVELAEAFAEMLDDMALLAESLWAVLANVSGGDWSKQSPEWQAAAGRERDGYLDMIGGHIQETTPVRADQPVTV